jgi:competence protein ComEC
MERSHAMALASPQLGQPFPSAAVTDVVTGVWHAPLVPVALLTTAGIVADRYAAVPLVLALVVVGLSLLGWAAGIGLGARRWPYVLLLAGCAAGGAAWHHYRRDVFADNDIGRLAPTIPHPVQLRGVIEEEPLRKPGRPAEALRSIDRTESVSAVLRVTEVNQQENWVPLSGRVRLVLAGPEPALHVGDGVEVAGRLSAVEGPANPGEFDQAAYLRDKGVRAQVVVRKTPDGMTRLERGWPTSPIGCLMAIRGWGQEVLAEALPADTSGVATALLLGEGSPLTADDWDRYVRGGVIHVLAISGQHLVILGLFLWWVLRLFGVRQRRGAVLVAVFLLLYALLTGGHPPAMRSAITVCALALGLVLRRRDARSVAGGDGRQPEFLFAK